MDNLVPKILDKLSEVAENQAVLGQKVDDSIKRWDSWKDGQTIFMHKMSERIDEIKEKMQPLERDLIERNVKKNQKDTGWFSVKYGILQVIIISLIMSVIVNIHNLWTSFVNFINR